MYKLDDDLLLESYKKAIGLKLDPAFIYLIEKEIKRRGLDYYIRRTS
ncbi:sporulation histidine kinase inhibitor Sda [Bacillus sp. EAC]|nr:sporulation histidine kinase inhibitor Sda [Bacillus sp. EAC]